MYGFYFASCMNIILNELHELNMATTALEHMQPTNVITQFCQFLQYQALST